MWQGEGQGVAGGDEPQIEGKAGLPGVVKLTGIRFVSAARANKRVCEGWSYSEHRGTSLETCRAATNAIADRLLVVPL